MSRHIRSNGYSSLDSIRHFRKLTNLIVNGRIEFNEYSYMITLALVSLPDEEMSKCVNLIPISSVPSFFEYLQNSLEPNDFMPCPRPFLVGAESDEMIEQVKKYYRDKYISLFMLVRARDSGRI